MGLIAAAYLRESGAPEQAYHLRRLIWKCLAEGELGFAYHLTCDMESRLAGEPFILPSWVPEALLLGPALVPDDYELQQELLGLFSRFDADALFREDTRDWNLALRLVLAAAALRPAVLGPVTGAGTVLAGLHLGHTPVLHENKVIIVCDSKGENFITALKDTDGQTVWKTMRDNPSQSYSAPLIRTMAGRQQMIVSGNRSISSYYPATGKQWWRVNGPSIDSVATPVFNEASGLVLAGSSWPDKVVIAIRPDGEGDVTESKVVWSSKVGAPYVPSFLSVGPYLFTSAFSQEGHCLEAATGKVLWKSRMGLHHASPVLANGLVYYVNDDGVAHVVKAGPEYELVSRNEIGEKVYASPALSEGQLFLRTFKHLYCIEAGK
jgi:outer membrane protein assembly factor BamB